MTYSAVALFSGCGGFSEGVRLAGIRTVAAVDNDPFAAQTYRYNFPETPLFTGDIASFLAQEDPRWAAAAPGFAGLAPGSIDLVYGGPPCQGYSAIGTRLVHDPRNSLYREFVRTLAELEAPLFLMENVPNMLHINHGAFKTEALAAFAEAGYANSDVRVISANDYGVPQVRRRAIFFGVRNGLKFPYRAGDWLESGLRQRQRQTPQTVEQAIGDLPESVAKDGGPLPYPGDDAPTWLRQELRMDLNGTIYTAEQKQRLAGEVQLFNHHTKEIQARRRELVSHLRPGSTGKSLPSSVWTGVRPGKWRRLHPNRPAYTILAQMHRDLSEWVHPSFDRWITVREAARLQSFHDGFIFRSSERQMLKQIGNAVPPLMGHALASVAVDALDIIAGRPSSRPSADRPTAMLLA
jgi:DNA (cytosine-5)-methyltransferase 1